MRGLLVEPAPQRVQRAQPVEQVAAESRTEGPGQVLVEVVVGVDEPRRHQAVGGVDDAGRIGRLGTGQPHP